MKHQTLEEQLKTAFACGDVGLADCLHAAAPRVAQVADILVYLHEYVTNALGHTDTFANTADVIGSKAAGRTVLGEVEQEIRT